MVKAEVITPRSPQSNVPSSRFTFEGSRRFLLVLAVAVVAVISIIAAQNSNTAAPGRGSTPATSQQSLQVKPLSDRSAAAATTASSSTIQSAGGNSQTTQAAQASQFGPAQTPSLNTSATSGNTIDQSTADTSIGL